MSVKDIDTHYHVMLHSYGLPYRLQHGRPFLFSKSVKSFQITEDKVISPSKQQAFFSTCCKAEAGWLLYICADQFLDKPKHIAANIVQSYFEKDRKLRWLSSFDKLDKIPFRELNLVVIDSLFHDSAPWKRDKIYETINHHANKENLSVIVIGKFADPLDMASALGMRPDFAIFCK